MRYCFTHAYLPFTLIKILRLAEMDASHAEVNIADDTQAEDSQAQDDQTNDTADDLPEVEGGEESEGAKNGIAGHDEAMSSGEYTAGADSSVQYVRGASVKNVQASPSVKKRQTYVAVGAQRNVLKVIRDSLINNPFLNDTAEAYGSPENQQIVMVEENGLRCLSFISGQSSKMTG
ncbi:MAG: hypothetical protein J3R72DRAFT_515435 [Linnemannia gamsii]|nr:MAG: hypothetical protein J3R72DRAFT_515435 [Linnemannia gamsii]